MGLMNGAHAWPVTLIGVDGETGGASIASSKRGTGIEKPRM
jgi:hypothetical protein